MDYPEDVVQVLIRHLLLLHLFHRVGIDDLVAEAADRHVGPLRDVEHVVGGGLVEFAAVDGPEAAQYAEQGTLATPVRTSDEQVLNKEKRRQ